MLSKHNIKVSYMIGSDQYIKSSVRLYLAITHSVVIKYITFQFFFLLKRKKQMDALNKKMLWIHNVINVILSVYG